MGQKQQLPPGFERLVLNLYQNQGWPINKICKQYNVSYSKIRGILEAHNVPIRGRGTYTLRGADHPFSKLSDEDLESLENDLRGFQSHGKLAKKYGVSRERVRQIAERLGTPTGRELQMIRRYQQKRAAEEAKRRKQAEKEKAKFDKYALWRQMWKDGLKVQDMALELGLSEGSVSVRIVNLRKSYPDWFPLRRESRVGA